MRLSRRGVDLWLHAGLFSLYLGAFSVFGFARRLHGALGNVALLGLLGLTGALCLYAVWRSRRVPLFGVVLLGLLPYLHMGYFSLTEQPTGGAFIYLYKFSGYLLIPYLWLWARARDDRQIEATLMLVAGAVAARALLTFAVPGLATGSGGFMDDFIIWEWVGPLPRVFYPGMALMFLGLLLAIRDVFQASGRALPLGLLKAGLFAAALAVSMSRGTLIFAALLATLFVLLRFFSGRTTRARKGRLVLGSLLALNGAALVVLATPLSDTVGRAAAEYQGQERFSLDRGNLDWRDEQVRAAFSLVRTDEARLLGVGTTTFIPERLDSHQLGHLINELHYSYTSVRWTFGYLGLFLLVAFAVAQPLVRAAAVRPAGPLLLPMAFTLAFAALVGSYTIVFTLPDWAFMLALCGAYLNARCGAPRPDPADPAAAPARVGRLPARPERTAP